MNYCVKHNERCDSADASGHCSLTACNRYTTDENYLKKLADMQTQIKELIPDSLKENEERRIKENEYIQGDPDHNVQVALRRLKEIYWGNIITDEYAQKFAEARKIIISALIFGRFDIVRREK